MKVSKAVVQRPQADRDVEAAIDFYLLEAGERAALIGGQPGAGSRDTLTNWICLV